MNGIISICVPSVEEDSCWGMVTPFVVLQNFVIRSIIGSARNGSNGGAPLQPSYFIPFFIMIMVLYSVCRNRKVVIARKRMKNRKREDKTEMIELAKRFIGKECLVYSFDSSHQFQGVIKEVSNGAVLIEKDHKVEAINLEYVIRIREYPKKKNGKKKAIVAD